MPEERIALVVAAHGRRGFIEVDGCRRLFVVRGRRLRVVCGDRVRFEERAGSLLITGVEARSNVLARSPPMGHATEILAANLTQVIATCAATPAPDLFLVDRFLCAAELMSCRGVVAWNKCDLAKAPEAFLEEYRHAGYRVLEVSTRTGDGLDELRALLEGEVTVIVGQSGVGKSSLINVLTPTADATVGELSAASDAGTHTTTAVLMYRVGHSGRLLDTPGVRDFVPAISENRGVGAGFPEFGALGACRFANCRHDREPACTVKEAVARGEISARRYESYRRLLRTSDGASMFPAR